MAWAAAWMLTMYPEKTFELFPKFPAELRLQIYSHALPHRVLHLGHDFPLPFLHLPEPESNPALLRTERHRCLNPTRAVLLALFHVCHESRELCMSIYIPFAYTYTHPENDTLYISSQIAPLLHENLNWYYKCARLPLYPLAKLGRIAVEFDWLDLPPQVWRNSGWIEAGNRRFLYSSPLLESYLETFAEFGPPQELLVVAGNGEGREVETPSWWSQSPGWQGIESTPDPYTYEESRCEKILQYIHDTWYYKQEDVEWFRGSPPVVKIVGVKKEGPIWNSTELDSRLLRVAQGDHIARSWLQKEFAVNGRSWQIETDGSPYNETNMKKALDRAKMGEDVSLRFQTA